MNRTKITAGLGLLFGTLAAGTAVADSESPIPVVVTMLGPTAVRVRISAGMAMPCDSSESRVLIDGKYDPGAVLRATSTEDCVCVQHTYAPFIDTDWSDATLVCRPMNCEKINSTFRCTPAPDPTIRISIESSR